MKPLHILFLLFVVTIGCSTSDNQNPADTKTATPEVLQETPSRSLKFSKDNGRSNLVDRLYSEALTHDSVMNQLDKEIGFLYKQSYDSLEDWRDYVGQNSNFFNDARYYLQAIRDTNLRKEGRDYLDDIISKQQNSIAQLNQLDSNIQRDDKVLRDFHKMLKLVVANNLMENYRRNEMPDAETLERILDRYETLKGKTKAELKERK